MPNGPSCPSGVSTYGSRERSSDDFPHQLVVTTSRQLCIDAERPFVPAGVSRTGAERGPEDANWNLAYPDIADSCERPARAGRCLFRCTPGLRAGATRMSTARRGDSACASTCDGETGGRRQRYPDGLRTGRKRSVWPWNNNDAATDVICWMSYQTGGECLPFRLHLPYPTEARRQGVRSREGHVIVGPATQTP